MLCDNCKKREANVRYSENINGRKKELNLCEECSKKLGITQMDFSMPIDFSSFLGSFIEDFSKPEFIPMLGKIEQIQCNSCGNTINDIINTGKLGCKDCYETFYEELDPIIKKIQGSNKHTGRIGKIIDSKIEKEEEPKKETSKKEQLQEKLKQAIKEEKYEEAAKIRDEIKKLES